MVVWSGVCIHGDEDRLRGGGTKCNGERQTDRNRDRNRLTENDVDGQIAWEKRERD